MAQPITMLEYADIKNITVNDVIRNASEKGIILPNNPSYIIDDSTLKLIDPIYFHERKFPLVPIRPRKKEGPNIVGKIDLDAINRSNSLNVGKDSNKYSASQSIVAPEDLVKKLRDFAKSYLSETRKGRIGRVMSHGTYITFDEGISGFLSLKDITWKYIDDIQYYLLEGELLDVMILGFDEKSKKLLVGRKQLLDDPLLPIAEKMSVGQTIQGVLKKIAKKKRAYIEIQDGAIVEANIPEGYYYPEGDVITGVVEKIDFDHHLVEVDVTAQLIVDPKYRPQQKKEIIKPLKKNIAVVRFFDSKVNNFGFVVTNGLGIDSSDKLGTYYEYKLKGREWRQRFKPGGGAWIMMNATMEHGSRIATNGDYLTYDKNGLLLALPYRGKYAKIKGVDNKGIKHDYNIICHVLDEIKSKTDGKSTIVVSFAEYLSSHNQDQINAVIAEFLQDNDLLIRLVELLPNFKSYSSGRTEYVSSIQLLIDSIEKTMFKSKDIRVLKALPYNFDYESSLEQIIEILEKTSKEDSMSARMWLQRHVNICDKLKDRASSLSLDLLYVVYQIENTISLFDQADKSWNEVYKFLNGKSDIAANVYLCHHFANKDDSFVKQSNLKSVLDYETLKNWVWGLLEDETPYVAVLKYLADLFVATELDLMSRYVEFGIDISYLYGEIACLINSMVRSDESCVRQFIDLCNKKNVSLQDIMSATDTISDEMYVELFALTANPEYLNAIEDFDLVPSWLNNQEPALINCFLQSCQKTMVDDEDKEAIADTLVSISKDKCYHAMKDLGLDEQYKLLQLYPSEYAKDMVVSCFASTELFNLYIGEQWKKLKAQIPYVAFDLESDGESIREFAFRTNENTKVFQGEKQLNSLLRQLKQTEIIVGHRIKKWDINKVLVNKGFQSNAFVWDTLEIEILLNPCRYSYALRTGHTAQEDTELVDRLFWNQLYRLSLDEPLCEELKELLPAKINEIIKALREPVFSDFFKIDSGEDNFYQELVDTDKQVLSTLKSIDSNGVETLIVAPKRLWPRIAEHVSLSFMQKSDGIDFLAINHDLLKSNPIDDVLTNAILTRFISLSKTPVVANLAQYLRLNYLPDHLLENYLVQPIGEMDCVDMDMIVNDGFISSYKQVFFVGCEIENRINQYTLPQLFTITDFWSINSNIPMRLGASSYLAISSEERKLGFFKDVPQDAANVWIERTLQGKYSVNYNYNFYDKIKAVKAKIGKTFSVKTIPWITSKSDTNSVVLVYSEQNSNFNALQKRVTATSRYRATYWTYQFALLKQIHLKKDQRPIILLLDNEVEINNVESYARQRGFYVPEEGSLIRKMELIEHHDHGMLVATKDLFFDIVDWRKDTAYCYVWDHLAVEKHMMMWHGFMDEKNKSFLDDDVEQEEKNREIGSISDTYQSTLLSLWPVYEYYYRFIKANSIESSMYILDSFMEEYHFLSSTWGVSSCAFKGLWKDEKSFNKSLMEARKIFVEESTIYKNDGDIQTAKDVIFSTMVNPEGNPNKRWHDYQEDILPYILSRKENYLISLPTGGGKSILFQGPALYNAAYTNKLSIVVTPLKALMQDQVKELGEKGFITNVDYLNGDRSYHEVKSIYRKINGGEIAILYVTPERFRSRAFLNALTTRMTNDNGLEYMIFDEAHCISQWGMEFRPEYLNVIKKCRELKEIYGGNMCITMFSATITDMIYNQINEEVPVKRLGQDYDKKIYNPIRSHIGTSFKEVQQDMNNRLTEIVEYIRKHKVNPVKSRMLVFCKTRSQCEEIAMQLASELQNQGVLSKDDAELSVGYFHAGMDGDDREDTYTRFKNENDPLYILCATKAFGMGMDIPNIHYIVHLMPPTVLEDYLQEVGRAGRNKQMYEEAGFSIENPIPAVCLCSKEDIKKSKEQLLQSMLSWKNLEEIRNAINSYISGIQPLEKTKEYPIVVPNTLWANGHFDHSFTDFKIGLYWLERMGRIRMGYLSPAHINITLLDDDAGTVEKKLKHLTLLDKGSHAKAMLSKLRVIQKEQNESTIQISLQEIAAELSMRSTSLLDCMIWCEKNFLIRIEQETRCRIAFTRLSEVAYMLRTYSQNCAFHVILNATRSLLGNNGLKVEKNYSLSDIRALIDMESATLNNLIKDVHKTTETGKQITEKYMLWYNEQDKQKNNGLSLAKSYKNDLYKKRMFQVISLLELIPGVKVRSYLDTEKKCVRQSVIVENNTWKTFLDDYQNDSIRVLEYIQSENKDKIRWSDAIVSLGLENKGFGYFESILYFLNGMAYLSTDPLLPTGVEIYATDCSGDIIYENVDEVSKDLECKKAFDEASEIRNLRLCIMEVLATKINSKQDFQKLIGAYFSLSNANDFVTLLSKYYDESDPFWDTIRATAIKNAEELLKDNPQQWAIYNENSNVNVNVEAGPGSGKTHVLTMKCAKLIYHQHVNPESILVLAYNRAVVVELKSRLAKLFASLGLSRSASQLHLYTFHGLAKRICGDTVLNRHEMHEWEQILLNTIKNKPHEVRAAMPNLQYVFIDEFQDITQIRLNAMFGLKDIFSQLTFFTIGDKDQSIYGFEKKESMDPNFYYNQLYDVLKPKKMTMNTNYRSFPKILEAAARYLPSTSHVPVSCKSNVENEPKINYACIYKNRSWVEDFSNYVKRLKTLNVSDLAVFFRTNNEVYHGYSLIKSLNLPGIRIRVQGASTGELYRVREICAVLKYLEDNGNVVLKLEKNETEIALKNLIAKWTKKMSNWDSFYMDFAFVLILDYLDFAASDENQHTYSDMAACIRENLKEDNPQLYKLYDDKRYKDRRIFVDQQMNVVLTTMHKVKGLEFDAVIITPSVTSLPFNPTEDIDLNSSLTEKEKEQIEEEQRLLYVAYTRAKKFLFVYKGAREFAVERMARFASLEDQWGIRERKIGLENYNIGYNANYNFKNNSIIIRDVRKNDPLLIRKYTGTSRNGVVFKTFNIVHNERVVGQLSKKSSIAQRMIDENIECLHGFFVSDVFYWTYEDSKAADERALRETGTNTNFASGWSNDAIRQGFIFIVDVAGYGIV